MKIVFMGTPDFAVPSIEALINSGKHEVVCVVTQPDRPSGRGNKMIFSPVKQCAVKYNIEVFQPERIKTKENIAKLREYNADVFVVAAYGQILSKTILEMPKFGCVNVHASILPKYRGASPIQQAVACGEKESGVTIMQMDAGIDTGDILNIAKVEITDDDTGGSLHDKLAAAGSGVLLSTLDEIENGSVVRTKQDDTLSTHAPLLQREDGKIDWKESSKKICDMIRAYDPWPGAFAVLGGEQFKIWKAVKFSDKTDSALGTITASSEKIGIVVQASDGEILLTEIQAVGKKRMASKDYLRGNPIESGVVLE